ncbi:MAG: hypothetical protein LBT40_17945 [Deltaproteobacteria bacterium]|jgi:hypothetical protein|nr:hypothetical protein [Deltaproteobacteria bacterium]
MVLAAALAALTALAVLVTAAAATAQPGWHVFSSSETTTATPVTFTVRYPPGFAKDNGSSLMESQESRDHAPDESRQATEAIVQNFRLNAPERGIFVFMNVVTSGWSPEMREIAEREGYPELLEAMGRNTAETFGYTFDGMTHLLHAGLQAADIYLSATNVTKHGNEHLTFYVQRRILKGNYGVTASCFSAFMPTDTSSENFTSRDNPATREYCLPFFDSLAFLD